MQIYSIKLKRIYVFFLFIVVFCNAQSSSKEGPFDKLIIANAMIIPGHGGPAYGPADIIIEKNRIVQIISYNGKTGRGIKDKIPKGNRIIVKVDNEIIELVCLNQIPDELSLAKYIHPPSIYINKHNIRFD